MLVNFKKLGTKLEVNIIVQNKLELSLRKIIKIPIYATSDLYKVTSIYDTSLINSVSVFLEVYSPACSQNGCSSF